MHARVRRHRYLHRHARHHRYTKAKIFSKIGKQTPMFARSPPSQASGRRRRERDIRASR